MSKYILPKPKSNSIKKLNGSTNSTLHASPTSTTTIRGQVMRGRTDRIAKYRFYDTMDSDTDVSRALDIIAEHTFDNNHENKQFIIDWNTDYVGYGTTEIVRQHIHHWSKINRFESRGTDVVRNVIKYGDWFMFRNPTTFELYDIHPRNVQAAIIEKQTMKIIGWNILNFRWNTEALVINTDTMSSELDSNIIDVVSGENATTNKTGGMTGDGISQFIPAHHIIHLSLNSNKSAVDDDSFTSSGIWDGNKWPFGNSWLDKVARTYNQKSVIEEATLVHRLQRAPNRHVFFIDTGRARADRAEYIVERFKNEIIQKRIPTRATSGNTTDMSLAVDGVYNPLSQLDDIYIPVSFEQQGSKIEKLEGQPWTEIPELEYFKQKMASALRVPYAWLQPNTSGVIPADGKIGVASQEEIEFSRFCMKIQRQVNPILSNEFKKYTVWRGVNISWNSFEIRLNPPTDYQASRDRERLNSGIESFKALLDVPFISKRLAIMKTLGWTEDDITLNEKMMLEENKGKPEPITMDTSSPYGSMGMTPVSNLEPNTGITGDDNFNMNDMTNGLKPHNEVNELPSSSMKDNSDMDESTINDLGEIILNENSALPHEIYDIKDSLVKDIRDDGQYITFDPIKEESSFIVKLSRLKEYRVKQIKKTIDWKRRKQALKDIYNPSESGGGF